GILVQSIWASLRFSAEGVPGFRAAGPVLIPIALGSLLGALTISRVADATFERLFGLVMVGLLLPILGGKWLAPKHGRQPMSRTMRFVVFFAIGIFGGAFQAGVGLFIVLALVYAGHDLVHANSIKVVVNTALTAVAVPVFVAQGQVDWPAAAALSVGFIAGSTLGVRLAVRGGERVIRPVFVLAVLLLAGRMLEFY
ncbi:MAG: sulfite exporter TauE/SafE family protein, partial [Mycobacterium sp.]